VIVLDTATWIRLAVNAGEISATARGHVESASVRYVSAISAWEVALLVPEENGVGPTRGLVDF